MESRECGNAITVGREAMADYAYHLNLLPIHRYTYTNHAKIIVSMATAKRAICLFPQEWFSDHFCGIPAQQV